MLSPKPLPGHQMCSLLTVVICGNNLSLFIILTLHRCYSAACLAGKMGVEVVASGHSGSWRACLRCCQCVFRCIMCAYNCVYRRCMRADPSSALPPSPSAASKCVITDHSRPPVGCVRCAVGRCKRESTSTALGWITIFYYCSTLNP
jgi:hypothetical protein